METSQKRPLITELTQGEEFTNELKNHLDDPMSAQTCDLLIEKILSSYEKALSMLNWRCDIDKSSTCFDDISPRTELSDPADSNYLHNCKIKNVFNKRKIMEKWSEQVKVYSETMVDVSVSDGYSWRKYGQKEILGANHPRAYYRCTHRNVQGCLATKQVQRSDEDSSVFKVTYKGRHTCNHATQPSKALEKQPKNEENIQDSRPTKKRCMDRVISFKFSNEINTSDEGLFPSFSFASTPIETEKLENLFYAGCDSTTFVTLDHSLQSSDSDFSGMMNSAPNSSTNLRSGDCDMSFDHGFFDNSFLFDITNSEMFA
ncbi:probable WRKY transcription factor 46 [Rutidosis leptorrhynchoides]|uniref:probable WRKY transcription factor 46 n=1 Tax=Rutidosis leptorrhynchoides TaxID=125765 RepID=UPI003A9908F7